MPKRYTQNPEESIALDSLRLFSQNNKRLNSVQCMNYKVGLEEMMKKNDEHPPTLIKLRANPAKACTGFESL